jgi:PKHD-type hydroxylase
MKGLYKVVNEFLSKDECQRLVELLKKEAGNNTGDPQVPKSISFSNFPACNILLGQLTLVVSKLVGKKLSPSYTYARIYLKGADLAPHKDRPSCEYSLTVNLAQSHPWPIYMAKKEVLQNPGDAVLYKGCEIEHSRKVFEGDEYVQVFFHYVDSEGPHKNHVYDSVRTPQTMYRFLFENTQGNHSNYYKFVKGVPELVVDKLRANLDTKQLEEAKVGTDQGVLNTEKRRSKVYWLPKTDEFFELYKLFFEFINKCNNEFYRFRLAEIIENIQYTVYEESVNGHYDWHIDMGPEKASRKLSLVCQLSDPSEYEGGELQINTGEILIPEKEKGTVIIFPSYLLHRVTPVTKGTRRSLVLWIEGPAFT